MCDKVWTVMCGLLVTGLGVSLTVYAAIAAVTECHDLLDLDARMEGVNCMAVDHAELARDVRHGDVFYLAGLVVEFNTTEHQPISNATALYDIEPDFAWLSANERRHFYESHPLGSMTRCYYDADAPRDRVALRDGVRNLGRRVVLHAFLALVAATPALIIAAVVLSVVALAILPLVACALSGCANAGRATWARCRGRPYVVFGQSAAPAADVDEQGL
jgi:hypothetical protein